VPADETLVFSFIGFESVEVPVNGRSTLNVVLNSGLQQLTEVVVVGAPLQQRELTGSVVSIDDEVLEERPVTSITEALQGRATGVRINTNPEPGGGASIRVRGINSMHYGGNPIFVVDGIVMERDFNMVNLNDVASINVLKDASATALYGSRGANGVVVITTKRGQRGKGKITYDAWFGVKNFANESLTLGAQDVFDLRVDALMNAGSVGGDYFNNNPGASQNDFIDDVIFADDSNWVADYELETLQNGKSYNWMDEVTRTAFQQNHSISFSGATEETNYYLSFGYTDEEGLVESSNYKRYSGRINAEHNINNWLKIGTNTSFTKSNDDLVDGSVFGVARGANPLLPIDEEHLYLAWGQNWDVNSENPLRSKRIDKDRVKSRIYSSNYLNIKPTDKLNFRSTFAIDHTDQKYYEYIPSDVQQAKRGSFRGRAIHNFDNSFNYQWDNTLTYEDQIGAHKFTALAGTSMSENQYKWTNVLARDFPTDDFGYNNLGAAFDKEQFQLGSDITTSTLMSYIGRINYNFDKRYYFTLTGRYDGSSKFAEGQKWGFFPSVSLAWNLTNEEFMTDQDLFDRVNLRMGYGSVGNQAIPDYAFYSLYYPSYSDGNVSFNSTGLRGTEALTWEKQDQFNLGLDLSFLDNRVQFSADYFDIVNSNLLMRRSLSTLTGYNEAIENIGEMTNRGIELSVDGLIIDNNDLSWSVSANISSDKNEITELYGDVDAIYNFGGFSGTEIQRTGNFFLGESMNTIYTLEFDRIIQEEDMDYVNSLELPGKTLQPGDILPKDQQAEGEDGYGIINEEDRKIIGNTDPDFYGGFSSEVKWRGISLNAVFTYSSGAKAISGFYEGLMNSTGFSAAHTDMLDRWSPESPDTNIPRATYDNPTRFTTGETSWGVQDASYLRLSTLRLGYDLPESLINSLGIANCQIYTSGNNLVTWTDYKGYDPENGDWYPTARMFVIGLKLSF
jgi:TonB-linked SusC/RagA family outer membrane protein